MIEATIRIHIQIFATKHSSHTDCVTISSIMGQEHYQGSTRRKGDHYRPQSEKGRFPRPQEHNSPHIHSDTARDNWQNVLEVDKDRLRSKSALLQSDKRPQVYAEPSAKIINGSDPIQKLFKATRHDNEFGSTRAGSAEESAVHSRTSTPMSTSLSTLTSGLEPPRKRAKISM